LSDTAFGKKAFIAAVSAGTSTSTYDCSTTFELSSSLPFGEKVVSFSRRSTQIWTYGGLPEVRRHPTSRTGLLSS
jgi:hypothetical protein